MKRLLALFASSSGIELAAADLRAAIGAPAYDALAEAGVLVASPPATSVPCDEPWRGCGRDVVAAEPGARCPWLGVCRSVEAPCPVRELSDDELSRQRVDEHALCRLLAVALGVLEEDLAPPAGSAGAGGSAAGGAELALLGVLRGAGAQRDVFLARRPGGWLADALVLRERSPRPSLVAVPTAGAIARPLLDRYLASDHVTLVVLEDALSVQRGRVVPRPRLVASSGGAGESRQGALGLPPISRFAEVTVRRVDGHTVRVVVRGKSVRLTYHDLGMASRQNREPTRAWAILMALCEGRGRFRYKDFGSFDTAKRQVSYLRTALRAAFACEDDPFPAFDPKEGWKPAFTASDEDPGDLPLSRLSCFSPTKDERPALGGPDPPSRVVGTALDFRALPAASGGPGSGSSLSDNGSVGPFLGTTGVSGGASGAAAVLRRRLPWIFPFMRSIAGRSSWFPLMRASPWSASRSARVWFEGRSRPSRTSISSPSARRRKRSTTGRVVRSIAMAA